MSGPHWHRCPSTGDKSGSISALGSPGQKGLQALGGRPLKRDKSLVTKRNPELLPAFGVGTAGARATVLFLWHQEGGT